MLLPPPARKGSVARQDPVTSLCGAIEDEDLQMTRMHRVARIALVAIAVVVAGAGTAGAEVVTGSCAGTVTFRDGPVIDADQPADEVVEIPAEGTLDYEASLDVEVPAEPVPSSGDVSVLLPVGSVAVADWSDESTETTVTGTETYVAPWWVPEGSGPIPLELVHVQGDTICRAQVAVTVAGSPLNATTAVIVLLTLVLGILTATAGRDRGNGSGQPVLGTIAGLLFGFGVAATLFALGAFALNSWWFIVLSLLGVAVGVALAMTVPFGPHPGSPAPGGGERVEP